VRHPFYSAILSLNYTVALAALSYYALIAMTILLPMWWYLVHIEETDLVRVWGQKYLDYKKNVPMFLPRLRRKRTSVV
jgi:protein-S-isoprenylcysteine O-methyltransferase Ste14